MDNIDGDTTRNKRKKKRKGEEDWDGSSHDEDKPAVTDSVQRKERNSRHNYSAISYRDRLIHACRKDLHKRAKICKQFHYQKQLRKMTLASTPIVASENNTEASNQPSTIKITAWKSLPLDKVLKECFKRLGISDWWECSAVSVKSNKGKGPGIMPNTVNSTNTVNTNQEESMGWSDKIERLLQYKKMREAIEKWSGEITKYQNWCARQLASPALSQSRSYSKPGRNSPVTNGDNDDMTAEVYQANHSLFVTLNSTKTKSLARKKRRQNPRSHSKESGDVPIIPQSDPPTKPSTGIAKIHKSKNPSDRVTNRGEMNEEGEDLHPSWKASKQNKPMIVAFQGKKITF